jgi:hypothetical protein
MDAGDLQQTRAFEEIVSEYAEGLYRFAYTILGNREDARDAAQRALVFAVAFVLRELGISAFAFATFPPTCHIPPLKSKGPLSGFQSGQATMSHIMS